MGSADEELKGVEDDKEELDFNVLDTEDDNKHDENLEIEVESNSNCDENEVPKDNIVLVKKLVGFIPSSLFNCLYVGLELQKFKQISPCKCFASKSLKLPARQLAGIQNKNIHPILFWSFFFVDCILSFPFFLEWNAQILTAQMLSQSSQSSQVSHWVQNMGAWYTLTAFICLAIKQEQAFLRLKLLGEHWWASSCSAPLYVHFCTFQPFILKPSFPIVSFG